MKLKPTKVSKEDLELADEISRVATIKELVADLVLEVETQFVALEVTAEQANPVATYKQIGLIRGELLHSAQQLQAQLLLFLGILDLEGEIDSEDALALLPSSVQAAGTMDAALESTEPTIQLTDVEETNKEN